MTQLYVDSSPASAYEIRTTGAGPAGQLSVTEETLRQRPRGDLFGRTRDAGMGFPAGCLLITGRGIVQPGRLSRRGGDEVRITTRPIGTLVNTMR